MSQHKIKARRRQKRRQRDLKSETEGKRCCDDGEKERGSRPPLLHLHRVQFANNLKEPGADPSQNLQIR